MLTLVDLSNNNPSPVGFAAIKQHGIYGMWHKVTEGTGFVDADWRSRSNAARAAGLRVGGYHFAHPGESSPEAQAELFCHHLGLVARRDLHPALDLEVAEGVTGERLHAWATAFLAHVHKLTGVKAITYTGPWFVTEQRWTKTFGTGAGLWLADYGVNDGTDHGPHIPPPWRRIVAHQFTSVGRVPGVNGPCDMSHASSRRKLAAHGIRGIL